MLLLHYGKTPSYGFEISFTPMHKKFDILFICWWIAIEWRD